MKVTKEQFVKLMVEHYKKKTISEAPEGQGDRMEEKEIAAMSADVKAILKQINSRLQGKLEWFAFAKVCLEFLLEYKEEGATETDLKKVAAMMGKEGTRLYTVLKILSKVWRDSDPNKKQDQKTDPSNDQGSETDQIVQLLDPQQFDGKQ